MLDCVRRTINIDSPVSLDERGTRPCNAWVRRVHGPSLQSRGAAGGFQSTPSSIPQRYESEAAGGTHSAPVLVGIKAPHFARPFQASALTPTVRRSLQAFTAGRLTPSQITFLAWMRAVGFGNVRRAARQRQAQRSGERGGVRISPLATLEEDRPAWHDSPERRSR